VRSLCRCPGATGVLRAMRRLTAAIIVLFFGEVTQMPPWVHPLTRLLFYRGQYGTYARRPVWKKVPTPDGSLSDFAPTGWS